MKIVFRLDDIYLNSNAIENQIFGIFEKHQVPLNIGIIPFDKSEMPFVNSEVTLSKNLIPCLHGYTHSRSGTKGEFDGLTFEAQFNMLEKGKSHLVNNLKIDFDCFIPPWNKYDENTIRALEKNQINYISGSLNKEFGFLNEIPCSVEHFDLIDKFWFRLFLRLLPQSTTLVILFHNYNFSEHSTNYFKDKRFMYNFDKLDRLISKLKKDNHMFLKITDVNVSNKRVKFISDIIKKLTGQRVNFWL